ncbi:MAG: DAK2 domain-containing protein [Peptococcaceae bacterium]|nr:DAK2 domain-containing protein [Peptococcaceae bacterium]
MSKLLNISEFIAFFVGASANLTANKEQINALNVFPVPDGDTGTNMGLTMSSAVKELSEQTDIPKAAERLAHGALLGARGNSGVILSQILRGFAQGLDGCQQVGAVDFARAMQKGVELAYKSVMRPVEGTILTVARKMAEASGEAVAVNAEMDLENLLELMLAQGHQALANTPNQLPVLKQAGVVDSGASGLVAIFEGGLRALRGEEFELPLQVETKADFTKQQATGTQNLVNHYCTEFFIHGQGIDVEAYRRHLQGMGESQVIVGNATVVKTHIHTADPGAVLSYALQFGSLHDLKIDNMKDQHRETLLDEVEKEQAQTAQPELKAEPEAVTEASAADLAGVMDNAAEAMAEVFEELGPVELPLCGAVAVSSGSGLDQIFTEMGVNTLVSGGQSMNPSAEDILQAINNTTAQQVVVLPNNSNIVMAANQASQLADKPVVVVPSKFITQGIAAMMNFDPESSAEENAETMQQAAVLVHSGQITYAVRDSQFDGQEIHEGDILGLLEGTIAVVEASVQETMLKLLPQMFDDDTSLITLLYGEGVTEDEAEAAAAELAESFPDYEIEVQLGGQAVYHYLLAVE